MDKITPVELNTSLSVEQKEKEQENLAKEHGVLKVKGNNVTVEKSEVIQISKEARAFELKPKLVNAYERKLRAEEEIAFLEAEIAKTK